MKKPDFLKKKKKREKQSDRKYMSYEDVPLTTFKDNDPAPANLTKKFFKVLAIMFVGVITVLALVNIDKLTPDNISHWIQYELLGKSEGGGYPARFVGTSINTENFAVMDRSPVYCSNTSIVVLNSNAGEYQNNQHSFANPIMKTYKDYSLIYNADATGYRIIDRNSILYSGTAEHKLFDADIAGNGTYALLTYGSDYLSELTVNGKDNKKIYGYSFAEYYVSNVSVSPDGTRAALSGISAKDGALISVIYILDFSQKAYFQKYEFEDTYIYDICYLENNKVIAIGDNAVIHVDIDKKKFKELSYNSRVLTTYSIKKDYGVVLSLSENPDGRECDIVAINSDGKKDSEVATGQRILSLDYYNEKICVLMLNDFSIYNFKGSQLYHQEVSSDARKICFCDANTLYILGTSNIYKYQADYS